MHNQNGQGLRAKSGMLCLCAGQALGRPCGQAAFGPLIRRGKENCAPEHAYRASHTLSRLLPARCASANGKIGPVPNSPHAGEIDGCPETDGGAVTDAGILCIYLLRKRGRHRVAGKIFVNYRRSQSLKEADHLATILGTHFGEKRVFVDVRGIAGFSDWFEILREQVEGTAALIALIGRDWLGALDKREYPDNEATKDFVRYEIAEALKRNIPVLPVLLDGATLPKEQQLPMEMRGLLRCQGMELRETHFTEDAAAISEKLSSILAETPRYRRIAARKTASLAVAALGLGIAAGAAIFNTVKVQPLQEQVAHLRTDLGEQQDARSKAEERAAQFDTVQSCVEMVYRKLRDKSFEPDILLSTSGGDGILSILLSYKYKKFMPIYWLHERAPAPARKPDDTKYDQYGVKVVSPSTAIQYFIPRAFEKEVERNKKILIFEDKFNTGNTLQSIKKCVLDMKFQEQNVKTAVMEVRTNSSVEVDFDRGLLNFNCYRTDKWSNSYIFRPLPELPLDAARPEVDCRDRSGEAPPQ